MNNLKNFENKDLAFSSRYQGRKRLIKDLLTKSSPPLSSISGQEKILIDLKTFLNYIAKSEIITTGVKQEMPIEKIMEINSLLTKSNSINQNANESDSKASFLYELCLQNGLIKIRKKIVSLTKAGSIFMSPVAKDLYWSLITYIMLDSLGSI